MLDLHDIDGSANCGTLRTDPSSLYSIDPALGCRCGNLKAPRIINVRMVEELDYSVLYVAFLVHPALPWAAVIRRGSDALNIM